MSAEHTGADALVFYHTGSERVGGAMIDPAAALGGNRSGSRAVSKSADRPAPISGIEILYISGMTPNGVAILTASDANTLSYTPPGETIGATVQILVGETKQITGADDEHFLIIRRKTSDALRGSESFGIVDRFHNAIGGGDFTEAESTAGASKWRGLILKNHHTATLSNIKVWTDEPVGFSVLLQAESTVSEAITAIADEDTDPASGIPTAHWTEGGALNLGSLTSGSTTGLWIVREISALSSAAIFKKITVHYKYTKDGGSIYGKMIGCFRIAEAGIALYELYIEDGITPDPDIHTPKDTSANGTFSYAWSPTLGDYYRSVYKRNKYGVLGAELVLSRIMIDALDAVELVPPRGPSTTNALPDADGAVCCVAVYFPSGESMVDAEVADLRADEWRVYIEIGADPVVGVSTPEIVAMATAEGMEPVSLSHTSSVVGKDGAPMHLLITTYRSSDGKESENRTATICTANDSGAHGVQAEVFIGKQYGDEPDHLPSIVGTIYLDQPNDLRIEAGTGGSLSFYFGAILLWRCFRDIPEAPRLYIPSDWALNNTEITGVGVSDIAEVSGTDIYICSRANRIIRFDTAAKIIYAAEFHTLEALIDLASESFFKQRYTEAVFYNFSPLKEDIYPYAEFLENSILKWDGHIDQSLNQAGIEAL